MTDGVTSSGNAAEQAPRNEVAEIDALSKASEVAHELVGDVAVKGVIERPESIDGDPEAHLSPEGKAYLSELRETFWTIIKDLAAGKLDIEATFQGRAVGHYFDDTIEFVKDQKEVEYIKAYANSLLNEIEKIQAQIEARLRREKAKNYFENRPDEYGQRVEARPLSMKLNEPETFLNRSGNSLGEDVEQALLGIWEEYKASSSIDEWKRRLVTPEFAKQHSIEQMSPQAHALLRSYIRMITQLHRERQSPPKHASS